VDGRCRSWASETVLEGESLKNVFGKVGGVLFKGEGGRWVCFML
jgi:hypothetical protein